MPLIHKPAYPVVDPDPDLGKTVGNFNLKDWAIVGAWSTAGYTAGWFGASKLLRVRNGRFLSGIGFVAGMTYSYLTSTQRFMGIYKNDYEVQRYGAASKETMEEFERHLDNPNLHMIEAFKFRRQ